MTNLGPTKRAWMRGMLWCVAFATACYTGFEEGPFTSETFTWYLGASIATYVIVVIVECRCIPGWKWHILCYKICIGSMLIYFFKLWNGLNDIKQSCYTDHGSEEIVLGMQLAYLPPPFTDFLFVDDTCMSMVIIVSTHCLIFVLLEILPLHTKLLEHNPTSKVRTNVSCFCCVFTIKFIPWYIIGYKSYWIFYYYSFLQQQEQSEIHWTCSNVGRILAWMFLSYSISWMDAIAVVIIANYCSDTNINNNISNNSNDNIDKCISTGSRIRILNQNSIENKPETFLLNVNAYDENPVNESKTPFTTCKTLFNTTKSHLMRGVNKFNHRCLIRYNTTAQTFIVIVNALITTTATSIIFFATYNDCVYKELNSKGKMKTHFRASCSVRLISIGIGVGILIVVFFSYYIQRCQCYRFVKTKLFAKCGMFDLITTQFSDTNFRLIIVLKFAFFAVKPALIAITNEKDETISLIINLTFTGLTFLSVSVLAFATYNRKYRLLSMINVCIQPLDVKIVNPRYFAKLHIFGYILTVIQTYSVSIIILVFILASHNEMTKTFLWSMVVYPPGGWLLFMKLYLNEVSHLINALQFGLNVNVDVTNVKPLPIQAQNRVSLLSDSLSGLDQNDSHNMREGVDNIRKVYIHLRRLLLFQGSVVVGSVFSIIAYGWCIGQRLTVVNSHKNLKYVIIQSPDSWNVIWMWQLLISLSICIVMLCSINCSFILLVRYK